MNVIDVIQQAQEMVEAERARRPKREGPPTWRPQVTWLHNPSVMCCWCDEWVATKRVWAIDEERVKVLGVWLANGDRLPLSRQVHPHVFDHGGVCTGDGDAGVMDALWAGLNPSSPASGTVDEWLRELGHWCENLGDKRKLSARVEAVEVMQDCEGCGDTFPEGEGSWCSDEGIWFCGSCWGERHSGCEECGNAVCNRSDEGLTEVVDARGYGRAWCDSCRETEAFWCEGCERDLTNDQYEKEGFCGECWKENHSDCEGCGEEFEDDELVDGRCTGCQVDEEALVCEECEARVEELVDGKCRRCVYGTGEGQLELVMEGV